MTDERCKRVHEDFLARCAQKDMAMHDSRQRQTFGEGAAKRDTADGKPKFSLLSPRAWESVNQQYGCYVRDYLLTQSLEPMYACFKYLLQEVGWTRLCAWLELGAQKYERFNWAKGMPISRCIDSLGRHLDDMEQGLLNEDHSAAALCNVMFIVHYHTAVDMGYLPAEFKDLWDFNRMQRSEVAPAQGTPTRLPFDKFQCSPESKTDASWKFQARKDQ